MEQLTYATLYTGSDTKTHFKEEAMPWHPVASAATEPPHVTPLHAAPHIGFLHSPVGRTTDWHPAPRKQFVMVLTGSMEVEAGDGEKRTFTPGSVLLVTDGDGMGHKTRVVGAQEVLLVWVPIPSLTTSLHTSCGKSVA
jgi:quercetin dioxygenase-like cupin family protein